MGPKKDVVPAGLEGANMDAVPPAPTARVEIERQEFAETCLELRPGLGKPTATGFSLHFNDITTTDQSRVQRTSGAVAESEPSADADRGIDMN
ncbi:hypothetical protein [Ensifer canadensis]